MFCAKVLNPAEVEGKRILEVGSIDVNGSVRPIVESWGPSEYVGVDMSEGRGVDRVCRAEHMVAELGAESFDVVVATEILEHVRDWRAVISNIKNVCRPGGVMLITSPSIGYPFHAFPHDFWRYETSDMESIFEDCTIERLEKNVNGAGVCVKVRKPEAFQEKNLADYALYSVVVRRRVRDLSEDIVLKERRKKFVFENVIMRCMNMSSRVLRLAVNRL